MITNYQKISQSSKKTLFRVLRQISYTKLFKKYSSGNFNYNKILANYLVFNDSCRIVARFKDYLILDDNTEFLRRFYYAEESHPRLDRILNFYETYSKIFPNYMILKESKYLYRNIRKKQKMIDAVNEIKREEEENRKKMKQNNDKNNNINNINELFTKKVKEEIKTFQENTTFQRNNFDSDNDDFNENSISISLINKKMFENMELNLNANKEIGNERNTSVLESFVTNETNHSISGILNILNDNKIYIKDLPKILEINNYSKKSLKIKKINKIPKKEKRESEINEKNIKFQKSKNKQSKKYETFSRQYQLNKNTLSNSSNLLNSINNNYIATKGELKKLSILSTSPGTVLASNTEKNVNEINQYQNIIIPKGSTVININNNYFDQNPTSSILQMGYYSNKNFQLNKNSKTNSNNYNYSSTLKKSNTNNNYKNNNNLQLSEKKTCSKKFVKTLNNENKFVSQKKANYAHNKQISQDFIYQKFKNNNEVKSIQEKLIKINSLSPTPIISRYDAKYAHMKTNTYLPNEKDINSNYLSENNNPNLITGNLKTDECEDIERNRLLLYIREIIENKKKENGENMNELKEKKILSDENEIINNNKNDKRFSFNIFSKYKTISNFKSEDKNYSNMLKEENRHLLEEKCFSKKDVLNQKEVVSKEKNKSNSRNKKEKSDKKNKYKKIQIKDKKDKSKGIIKNNKINSNYNTCHNTNSKNNSEKNKDFFKTNSNFKNHKNLFENMNKDNSLMKSMEKQIKKHNKLLSLNSQALKLEQEEKNHLTEKGEMTLSQSIIFKGKTNSNNSNSQMSKLLMSHKKENQNYNDNSASKKIYFKSKIKNLKYKKDNLNLDNAIKSNDINSICYSNANNFYTEYNNTNQNMILTDVTSNNKSKKPEEVKKYNNSELRYKYKNFLLKKNKIKSCEFENQSAIQNKNNKELVDRMNILNQTKLNYFYQNFMENQSIFGIKSYRANNISSFDNSNVNSKQAMNSKGKNDNRCSRKNVFQTPCVENKRIGLYKKVINKKLKLLKTEKKEDDKRTKNFITPATIKVNRSKFLENVKNKVYDNHSKTRIKK